jgi:hypothetical protein
MFDRAAIFRKAWAGYHAQDEMVARASAFPLRFSRRLFGRYLRRAWDDARFAQLHDQRAATLPAPVQAIRAELVAMEMSDAPIDWDRHRELNLALFRASVALGEARA